jgi:hypothetical protein
MSIDINLLHDAIFANPAAKALADAGDDAGAAATIAPTLPKLVVSPTLVTERQVVAAFAVPDDAETVLQALAAAGRTRGVLGRAVGWLAPEKGGLDIGHPAVRTIIGQLVTANVLTAAQGALLKALAEQPQAVTYIDVSAAWARHRPNGRITGQPS